MYTQQDYNRAKELAMAGDAEAALEAIDRMLGIVGLRYEAALDAMHPWPTGALIDLFNLRSACYALIMFGSDEGLDKSETFQDAISNLVLVRNKLGNVRDPNIAKVWLTACNSALLARDLETLGLCLEMLDEVLGIHAPRFATDQHFDGPSCGG